VIAPGDGAAEPAAITANLTEPAKLADRVIAPGDGAAEPVGSQPQNLTKPAKLATDVTSGKLLMMRGLNLGSPQCGSLLDGR
jgi:hypothetical protein